MSERFGNGLLVLFVKKVINIAVINVFTTGFNGENRYFFTLSKIQC